ncbi:MAG TPA: DegV family protein [Syntrophomonadaceae bacterium]|nr:DegV family protein [Syntrophomonadaceae bacterium]
MMAVRIYADNGCDLDRDLLESLGVRLFYMSTTFKGATYFDRLNLTPPQFYRMIAESNDLPSTSQVNLGEFQVEFERVVKNTDDHIIYIAFSSGLSGSYQSACLARHAIDPRRITVIDSKSASVGYGLSVVRAAQAVRRGLNRDQVVAEIDDNCRRMEHVFTVGNFDMLKRGGRVSSTAATLGNLLNIKLILHLVDGKIVPLEKVHGLKRAKKRLLDIMEERGKDLTSQLIGICYSQDYEGALEIRDMIQSRFGCQDFLISEIGAVIGSHVGAGTFAVFFLHE